MSPESKKGRVARHLRGLPPPSRLGQEKIPSNAALPNFQIGSKVPAGRFLSVTEGCWQFVNKLGRSVETMENYSLDQSARADQETL